MRFDQWSESWGEASSRPVTSPKPSEVLQWSIIINKKNKKKKHVKYHIILFSFLLSFPLSGFENPFLPWGTLWKLNFPFPTFRNPFLPWGTLWKPRQSLPESSFRVQVAADCWRLLETAGEGWRLLESVGNCWRVVQSNSFSGFYAQRDVLWAARVTVQTPTGHLEKWCFPSGVVQSNSFSGFYAQRDVLWAAAVTV